jgi:hypothetical protein
MEFNKEKILKYLKEGIRIFIFMYFVVLLSVLLFILISSNKELKESFEKEDILKLPFFVFIFYLIYTLYSIPVMVFFSYKIDKIREKIEDVIKNKIIIKKHKYLSIKVFMASLIALLCFFSQSLASYMLVLIRKIVQIEDVFSMEAFILSFILPLIYVFPFTYLTEKILLFYYKKKNAKILS